MDKVGHLYTAYFQGVLCYKGAKWTGLSDNKSIMVGAICGGLFQTTIEMMDAFSSEWGFSISDMGANISGIGLFALQQKYWGEQRISFKVSSYAQDYSSEPINSVSGISSSSLSTRADELYGASFSERYLKDYNAQTIWASVNIKSFLDQDSKVPDWLNVAVGYGANNMFGGYENSWQVGDETYVLGDDQERYQQFYLGLDVDFTRLKVKNHFLKSVLTTLNIFKIPFPAIELNSKGEFIFHLISK